MEVIIANRGDSQSTHVFEFFDPRISGRLWFIAVSDAESVQLLAPTFRTQSAAFFFEHCVLEHPAGFLLSIDAQLELARRIERALAGGARRESVSIEQLFEGLVNAGPKS